MNLLPESTMVEMGLTSYRSFLNENKVSNDRSNTQKVKNAGSRVSAVAEDFMRENGLESNLQYFDWEFNLIASKVPNAWCMPGGKIVFYEGILPYTMTEAGIAVVMGHEIAHALARHGNERMSQALMAQMGGIALAIALEEKPEETRAIFLAAYGLGAQIGVLLPLFKKT